jgi:hypothetical protein
VRWHSCRSPHTRSPVACDNTAVIRKAAEQLGKKLTWFYASNWAFISSLVVAERDGTQAQLGAATDCSLVPRRALSQEMAQTRAADVVSGLSTPVFCVSAGSVKAVRDEHHHIEVRGHLVSNASGAGS